MLRRLQRSVFTEATISNAPAVSRHLEPLIIARRSCTGLGHRWRSGACSGRRSREPVRDWRTAAWRRSPTPTKGGAATPSTWNLTPSSSTRTPWLMPFSFTRSPRSPSGVSVVVRAHLGSPPLKDRAQCLRLVVLRFRRRHRMDEQVRHPAIEDTSGHSPLSKDKERYVERKENAGFQVDSRGVENCARLFLSSASSNGVSFFHTPAVASNREKPRITPPEQCFAKVSTSRSGNLVG